MIYKTEISQCRKLSKFIQFNDNYTIISICYFQLSFLRDNFENPTLARKNTVLNDTAMTLNQYSNLFIQYNICTCKKGIAEVREKK